MEDLEGARIKLVANGRKVLCWRGKGQDCYIEDPFGVVSNFGKYSLCSQQVRIDKPCRVVVCWYGQQTGDRVGVRRNEYRTYDKGEGR